MSTQVIEKKATKPAKKAAPKTSAKSVKKTTSVASPSATAKFNDSSAHHNVRIAIRKLRALKSLNEINAFVKGEKRVTITRIIPGVINRIKRVEQ